MVLAENMINFGRRLTVSAQIEFLRTPEEPANCPAFTNTWRME